MSISAHFHHLLLAHSKKSGKKTRSRSILGHARIWLSRAVAQLFLSARNVCFTSATSSLARIASNVAHPLVALFPAVHQRPLCDSSFQRISCPLPRFFSLPPFSHPQASIEPRLRNFHRLETNPTRSGCRSIAVDAQLWIQEKNNIISLFSSLRRCFFSGSFASIISFSHFTTPQANLALPARMTALCPFSHV